jgi:hypothetical protein
MSCYSDKQTRWKSPKNLDSVAFSSAASERFPMPKFSCSLAQANEEQKSSRKRSEVWRSRRLADTLDFNVKKNVIFFVVFGHLPKKFEKFLWLLLSETESLKSARLLWLCKNCVCGDGCRATSYIEMNVL